ncbi:hypothetical protein J4218_01605 [Candidatus Pacearchaeota archaeon]|nr:hypothetical protein [Candidatus Pacearchaeota archaeon]
MTQKESDLVLLAQLNERLGQGLRDASFAVATDKQPAKVRAFNNSIEATLYAGGVVTVQSPRSPRVDIRLVDPLDPSFCLAPKGAIYEITTCKPIEGGPLEALNYHIATIYVTSEGLALNYAGASRAAELIRTGKVKLPE